jgi:Rrf2 family protein
MKLSMKTDYALRALFTLVEHYGRDPIPIRELARRNDAPKRFLEQILLALKSKGWVDSLPGKTGGYVLAQKPGEITIGEVVRHFDGVMAPIGCLAINRRQQCSQESVCRFRRVFLEIRNLNLRLIDRATLADVMTGNPVSTREVFDETFSAGGGI